MKTLLFPGQGTQYRGMGGQLWNDFSELDEKASTLLGYSLKKLCLEDSDNQLRLTQYTQPAIYVVSSMHYYRARESNLAPEAVVGHSVGEYGALLAAGCFDFETGLRLVQKRGQLMSQVGAGSMAAVLGLPADEVQNLLNARGLTTVSLANFNSPTQSVIAGDTPSILAAEQYFTKRGLHCIVLNVSAAFHSPHMLPAQALFAEFLNDFTFNDPNILAIANATGRPYLSGQVAALLARQVACPVLWVDSIRYLIAQGDFTYEEIGATPERAGSHVLSKLVEEIQRTSPSPPLQHAPTEPACDAPVMTPEHSQTEAQRLGSAVFRERYGLKYAYVAGGMLRGISSPALVARMAQSGMLAYLGTAEMSLADVEKAIKTLQATLSHDQPYGLNLMANPALPGDDRALVNLFLKCNVQHLEVSWFDKITTALVLFRVKGLRRNAGKIECTHRILAKVTNLPIAQAFMSPAPDYLVQDLLNEGAISADQAEMAKHIPMSDDLCVQTDSGGMNTRGSLFVLFPAVHELRQVMTKRFQYQDPMTLGLAGSIGTPSAAGIAFMLGADFILTGSINQCTVESGATDNVKFLLEKASIEDMTYAPSHILYESDSTIQVLNNRSLFTARATWLTTLYQRHNSLDDIPPDERASLERDVFRRSLAEVWSELLQRLTKENRCRDIKHAQSNPKVRMAHVFREYWRYSMDLALSNTGEDPVNYQIQTGTALGAFNQWCKNSPLQPWQHRHVDAIALALLNGATDPGCRQGHIPVSLDPLTAPDHEQR
ncbi:PfaD family polyunsaturated fatty acid/polyketide biosynthesis protein [Pseudomonas sp. TMW22091]|uniref:PfaD family polyunsaturated fatty acid/polyketide biosynthesis protein n=1 Tax=Pseudomonas sp. TMW22091 TaxID=2506435 RepID=UPI001F0FC8A7|nr:PfaD family polyunsaturated fatty acid/polyketide biosynthesis protein [Pseudomonas sp. TMW22091]MCH4875289.1 PfaD family polyunsaturated fatty acid/polyketide biosynthesis protein [Pseudomonas sp. TMW22091]